MANASKAKSAALAALHHSRRGIAVNDPGITEHQLRGLLADVQTVLRDPRPGVSARALAAEIGVSDKTVRRWLDGTDCPPSTAVRVMQRWLRHNS